MKWSDKNISLVPLPTFEFISYYDLLPPPIYKTLLLKSWKLRKQIFVLKLFVSTIVFTILSLRERVGLCFPYAIYC